MCGWQSARAASVALDKLESDPENPFYRNKVETARFYFSVEMPKVGYLADVIEASAHVIAEADIAQFG